jgi:hypothetical protein
MGIYDKLEKIRQGSPAPNTPVGSPNAAKMVEPPTSAAMPIPDRAQDKIETSTSPEAVTPKKETTGNSFIKDEMAVVIPNHRDTVVSRHRDTTKPRHLDTVTPRYHDTTIEIIRKAVKEFGKEAGTHRLTRTEKKAIADIEHTYKQQDLETCENQIARIAINFILYDYQENGENSILARTLKALNE